MRYKFLEQIYNISLTHEEILQDYDEGNITHHRSDINQDGCIALDEMTNFMDRWKISSLDVTMIELMESITLWKSGIGCS